MKVKTACRAHCPLSTTTTSHYYMKVIFEIQMYLTFSYFQFKSVVSKIEKFNRENFE